MLIGFLLSFPLFTVWLLVYDRQQQSEYAQASIAEGWGGPQTISGPLLVIPYRVTASEVVTENNRPVTRTRTTWRDLILSPEAVALDTEVRPEPRRRSIYEVVVYDADVSGRARFVIPQDLARFDVASPTSTWPAPSCASACPIRAASAPIRGSSPAAGRCGCSRAAAAAAPASSPGSTPARWPATR